MRVRACGALVVCIFLASGGGGRADDRAEALKIVDAAIKAAGGAAKLDKLKTVTLKAKGAVLQGEKEATFTGEGTMHGLDRFRFDLEVSIRDQAVKIQLAFSGDKGWRKIEGRVFDTGVEALPIFRAELHAFRAAQMLTPLKDKDVTLSHLGEIKIAGRAAVGIKITKKDHPDVDLYFDKETHLPIKGAMRLKEPETGQEEPHEWLFSSYKEIAGVKQPTKVVFSRDGQKFVELEISEMKPQEKVDEDVFAKP